MRAPAPAYQSCAHFCSPPVIWMHGRGWHKKPARASPGLASMPSWPSWGGSAASYWPRPLQPWQPGPRHANPTIKVTTTTWPDLRRTSATVRHGSGSRRAKRNATFSRQARRAANESPNPASPRSAPSRLRFKFPDSHALAQTHHHVDPRVLDARTKGKTRASHARPPPSPVTPAPPQRRD